MKTEKIHLMPTKVLATIRNKREEKLFHLVEDRIYQIKKYAENGDVFENIQEELVLLEGMLKALIFLDMVDGETTINSKEEILKGGEILLP